MTGTESTSEVMTHLTTGAVVVYAIQYLKAAGWCPWLTADAKTTSRIVSAVCAFAVAVGINGHWDPTHGGTFTIPPLAELVTGVFDFVKQFTTQQVIFDTVFNRPTVTVTVEHQIPSSLPPS